MIGGEGSAPDATIARIRCDLLAEHLGGTPEEVAARFEAEGSLIATIEALRGSGRTLNPLTHEELNKLEVAIADSEALDPESPGEEFEPIARPGLLASLRWAVRRKPRL